MREPDTRSPQEPGRKAGQASRPFIHGSIVLYRCIAAMSKEQVKEMLDRVLTRPPERQEDAGVD